MKKPQPHDFPWDEVLFQSAYWPGLCVAGLCIGAGAHLFIRQGSYVWGALGVALGIVLALLVMETLKTRRNT